MKNKDLKRLMPPMKDLNVEWDADISQTDYIKKWIKHYENKSNKPMPGKSQIVIIGDGLEYYRDFYKKFLKMIKELDKLGIWAD